MASPQRLKVSAFPETNYGVAGTANGRAYQVQSDGGPTPMAAPVASDGAYSGREGPVDETVEMVIKGYDLSYTKSVRTHGDELWFRDMVGGHGAVPVQVTGSTAPALYTKVFETNDVGPDGSLTFVVDRFTQDPSANTLTRSTYTGCMAKSWGLSVSADGDAPVELTTDFVAREETDLSPRVATAAAAPYPSATTGDPSAFAWKDCRIKIGAKDATMSTLVAASPARFLRSYSYSQDNNLASNRYYLQGNALMGKPFGKLIGSTVDIEFDYATSQDSYYSDFLSSGQISVLFEAIRPAASPGNTPATQYALRLYLPSVFLTNAVRGEALEDQTTLSLSGQVRWNKTGHLATLHYVTEGASIP